MNQISVPPGAFKFRLLIIIALALILMSVFLSYANRISLVTEQASIRQTSNIINSTLSVVFARYAVNKKLDQLNEVPGSNPFDHLEIYGLVPANYKGKIRLGESQANEPGWYYDGENGQVIYRPIYLEGDSYFRIELDYLDVNSSGKFEAGIDEYKNLQLRQLVQQ